ncbi:MAG: nucleotide sugar dehydrogenase, partial [Acidimicrobiales bacterium]
PERIDPGNGEWGLVNTPKVVSGIDAASLAAVKGFYDSILDRTVPVSGTREAELVKLLENTFRHVNIALVNELAMFAADLGIDVWEAIDAASTKPFGFLPFTPGPGVGGHCLPIDPSYLSWRVRRLLGQPFRFVELANDVNDHMPDYVVRRLVGALNRQRLAVNGSRVLLLGLAYKANTGDARESPAVVVADRLLALGAEVRAADPHVPLGPSDRAVRVECSPEELSRADIVVLLTDHDAFDFEAVARHAPLVLDTRHRLRGGRVEYL